ncbi:MAG: S-methyl-5'-thioinosine phosphorylase [Pseudomonadota bacterium]
MKQLGVISGTGITKLDGLEITTQHEVDTPYGKPSAAISEGILNNICVYFLQRHGQEGRIPPHKVNYRANVWALQSLGVTEIVAINAVGGISKEMQPGRLVIPDQIVDYTWGRAHTFDEGEEGPLQHVDFTEPYDRELRMALVSVAAAIGAECQATAVYGVTQGPRLETAAEIQRMAADGCDLVGMTGMPEASLARETGCSYASICMVVNMAAGLGDVPISLETIHEIVRTEAGAVAALLGALLEQRYSS